MRHQPHKKSRASSLGRRSVWRRFIRYMAFVLTTCRLPEDPERSILYESGGKKSNGSNRYESPEFRGEARVDANEKRVSQGCLPGDSPVPLAPRESSRKTNPSKKCGRTADADCRRGKDNEVP